MLIPLILWAVIWILGFGLLGFIFVSSKPPPDGS